MDIKICLIDIEIEIIEFHERQIWYEPEPSMLIFIYKSQNTIVSVTILLLLLFISCYFICKHYENQFQLFGGHFGIMRGEGNICTAGQY